MAAPQRPARPPAANPAGRPSRLTVALISGTRSGSHVIRRGEDQLAVTGAVVEQLTVASPVDGGVELGLRFVLAESAPQEVEGKPFAEGAVLGRFQGPQDGSHQRRTRGGRGRESSPTTLPVIAEPV